MYKKHYHRTRKKHDPKQLKNKLTHLRNNYKIFKNLMKNATRIGWDHLMSTFDATDQWWDKRIQVNSLYVVLIALL